MTNFFTFEHSNIFIGKCHTMKEIYMYVFKSEKFLEISTLQMSEIKDKKYKLGVDDINLYNSSNLKTSKEVKGINFIYNDNNINGRLCCEIGVKAKYNKLNYDLYNFDFINQLKEK